MFGEDGSASADCAATVILPTSSIEPIMRNNFVIFIVSLLSSTSARIRDVLEPGYRGAWIYAVA
jgi:hypothetical protein